jgi:hypothetical protein
MNADSRNPQNGDCPFLCDWGHIRDAFLVSLRGRVPSAADERGYSRHEPGNRQSATENERTDKDAKTAKGDVIPTVAERSGGISQASRRLRR